MTLATLSQLKTHLSIQQSDTKYDGKMTLFLEAATAWIEQYCDRKFKSENYVETIHGNRSNYIVTDQWPIISVSELRISSERDWTSAQTLIDSSSYGISSDKLGVTYYAGHFPRGFDNIRLSYRAGYEVIPADLQLGCLWAAEWFYLHNNRGDQGRTTASKGGESIGILSEVPGMIKSIIDSYRRMDLASSNLAPSFV